MAGLFDAIRSSIDSAASQQKQTLTPTDTGALSTALGTKATGKALAPTGGPAQTNIAAQVTAQQGQEAVQQQAQAAKAQVTGQEQQAQQAQAEGAAQSRSLQLQADDINLGYQTQLQDYANRVSQHTDEMSTLQKQADWDNLGRAYSLSSKKQVTDLQTANQIYMAHQDVLNNQALLEDQLGPAKDLLADHLKSMGDIGQVQNQIASDVAQIDIGTAMQIVDQQLNWASQKAEYAGVSSILQAGVGAYAKYDMRNPNIADMENPNTGGYGTQPAASQNMNDMSSPSFTSLPAAGPSRT
jgi:hypothetical protein